MKDSLRGMRVSLRKKRIPSKFISALNLSGTIGLLKLNFTKNLEIKVFVCYFLQFLSLLNKFFFGHPLSLLNNEISYTDSVIVLLSLLNLFFRCIENFIFNKTLSPASVPQTQEEMWLDTAHEDIEPFLRNL